MRFSKAFVPTLKETPADADARSHRLMLRAGMIRLHIAGVYSYLPLGWRVLRKISDIIHEEMDRIEGQEFLLPILSRMDLWGATGRAEEYGDDMFRLVDRRRGELCLAPTHEEIFTEIAAREIRSYRDLPQMWYQIQTKFRDEPRPRSGVLRGRQFLMKDAYSFDVDDAGLDRSYRHQRDAYHRIFERCGLDVLTVEASSGIMGGSESEEFMVPSPVGEARIVLCEKCGYASNTEVATSKVRRFSRPDREMMEKVYTPGTRTIDQVSAFLDVPPPQLMKSLLLIGPEGPVMALIRGDHEADEQKLEAAFGGITRPATAEEILRITGAPVGFIGPVGLSGIPIVSDDAMKGEQDLITGANEEDHHLRGVEPERDFRVDRYADLRTVSAGEECPRCDGTLDVADAIEVGHIFKLGTKYSKALGAVFLDAQGQERPIVMGSYGVGLERIMASVIEQHADKDGIVWPISIAPYHVHIVPTNSSDPQVRAVSEEFYKELKAQGNEVLLDDREERAGTKFKDADLIGVPIRMTVGERGLREGKVEIRLRRTGETIGVRVEDAVARVGSILHLTPGG